MLRQLGNIAAGQTVAFLFPTANTGGASVAPSPSGTITVYKDNDPANKTTEGITYSESFDGIVGLNLVTVETASEFYEAGHDYAVVLTGAVLPALTYNTLNGMTVIQRPAINLNTVLAEFSIENRYAALTATERALAADALLDRACTIDSKTVREAIQAIAARLVGTSTGAGTGIETFKGLDGVTDRVQLTVDAAGNRSTVSYDPH